MNLRVTAATHRGLVRSENQDAVVVDGWVAQVSGTLATRDLTVDAGPAVVAVLDGMGGHAGGALAAVVGAHALVSACSSLPVPPSEADVAALLGRANESVCAAAQGELADLGATVAAVVLTPESIDVVNAGDCRVYRLDPPYLGQLTVDDRVPSPQDPSRSLVSQSLGRHGRGSVTPHVVRLDPRVPQVLLLCSDGLHDVVDHAVVADQFAVDGVDARAVVQVLLRAALTAGAPDNVSVVIVEIGPDPR
ncbi:protein phosphatase 2C domain-containing protein [Nocardioides sp. W7]|uniref:PP2C family protein-serine/threonine phosphatase n=1 Tax=Nocardioides sp. W7 TaxID=2931390 RepID=UPI001FD4D65B|nr:protein phosphatase 2C domain-containing protein [Nocardioides sp. W7]